MVAANKRSPPVNKYYQVCPLHEWAAWPMDPLPVRDQFHQETTTLALPGALPAAMAVTHHYPKLQPAPAWALIFLAIAAQAARAWAVSIVVPVLWGLRPQQVHPA